MAAPRDYDVVVVGSGAAGLCAALEASGAGASVLLVESQGKLGGSSALSGGKIMAAGTSIQRRAGVEDTPDALYRDYVMFNQYRVGPSLARRLAFGAAPAVEWLVGMGVEFQDEMFYSSEEGVPRGHCPIGKGGRIVEVLSAEVAKRSALIDIALGRRVDRLLRANGAVVGVAVDDDEVRAGAVVLTTGGFGANPTMWHEHLPSTGASGASIYFIGAEGAQGDALQFAAQVGAGVVGHDRCLLMAVPDFMISDYEVYLPSWLMIVNREGRRVVDETTSYAVLEIAFQEHAPLFAIFDDAARNSAARRESKQTIMAGTAEDKHPPVDASPNFNTETIDEMVRVGRVKRGDTPEELGARLGINPEGLASTLERYNGFVKDGEDREFFKKPAGMAPLLTPPYYGTEMRRRILALTSKGPTIDADAHVLDRSGAPIPGLFAGGECAGGVLGNVYMGSGNAYANALVFGRTAGQSAARDALNLAS